MLSYGILPASTLTPVAEPKGINRAAASCWVCKFDADLIFCAIELTLQIQVRGLLATTLTTGPYILRSDSFTAKAAEI